MSSNKKAKEKLIELYGAECFIEKLKLRRYDKPVHYTSKGQLKRMKQLTYHHIKMKKDGGKATVENGALLSAENHTWFHQQSKTSQGYMNALFQEYKRQMDECRVVFVDNIEQPFVVDLAELEVKDTIQVKKFNRAKVKKETKELIDAYFKENQR